MDNSRELARLLRKAQQVHLEKTRPPLWIATGVFRGEEVPEPPDGVETFKPWIVVQDEETPSPPDGVAVFEPWLVFSCEGERPEGDTGQPIGKLCPLQ